MIREDLIERTVNSDPEVRRGAIRELARLEDPDALACLVNALADGTESVRIEARAGLKKMTGFDFGFDRDHWREWWDQRAEVTCNNCGRHLYAAQLYYLARVQLTSEPREIHISNDQLENPDRRDLDRLAQELDEADPADVQDQVYVRIRYYLCTPCKVKFVRSARKNGARDEES